MGKEGGLVCKVILDKILWEHVSEFKYLRHFLDELGKGGVECCSKVATERKIPGAV